MTVHSDKKDELVKAGSPVKTAEIIANKPQPDKASDDKHFTEDKRATARQEHHFTSRADSKGQ